MKEQIRLQPFVINLDLPLEEQLEEQVAEFERKFELQCRIFGPNGVDVLGSKTTPYCYICQKGADEVKFKKHAHIIPELFARNASRTFNECDSCNSKFKGCESDLASFIGRARRAIEVTRSKSGYVNHKDSSMSIVPDGSTKAVEIELHRSDVIDHMDSDSNSITLETVKPPYHPSSAFKALARIGFTMLDRSELGLFETVRNWLNSDSIAAPMPLLLWQSALQGRCSLKPDAMLFTANEASALKVLVVRAGRTQFQLSFPFDCQTVPFFPVMLDRSPLTEDVKLVERQLDMSSSEIVRGEVDIVTLISNTPIKYERKQSGFNSKSVQDNTSE